MKTTDMDDQQTDDDLDVFGKEALIYALEMADCDVRELYNLIGIPHRNTTSGIDLSGFSNVVLRAGVKIVYEIRRNIVEQQADDNNGLTNRGSEWSRRAGMAHRYYSWAYFLLTSELEERDAIAGKIETAHIRTEHVRIQAERARQKAEEKAARILITEDRNKNCQTFFIKAARDFLGREKFLEIWRHARAMFPDDPAWESSDAKPTAGEKL